MIIYRSKLNEILKINDEETGGEIEGINFEINGEGVTIVSCNKGVIEGESYLPIPYMVPVNLHIQDHGKIEEFSSLTTREYEFLAEWIGSDQTHQFEMRIPQDKLSEFMNSFIPALQEMEVSVVLLLDLEVFYLEDFMDRLDMERFDVSTYGPDAVDMRKEYDERLVSVGTVTVSPAQREQFIMEFALFVERFLLPQTNIIDYVDGKKQRLMQQIKAAQQAQMEESSMDFGVEFETDVKKEAENYVDLCMLRDNFLQGKGDPYHDLSGNKRDV
ncbi:MAG: hypothetical protein LRY73_14975, partial [Bacillus sp. (in: Bacteria)]|nr:hypothetical protein [Bacillus sp. (in: firmicutes)]